MNEYKFTTGKDSPGNNIIHAEALANDIPKLKVKCDTTPLCVGFTSDGWLKNKILPELLWIESDPKMGLYYTGISGNSEIGKNIEPSNESTQILSVIPKNLDFKENQTNQIIEQNPIISLSWKKICSIMSACLCFLIVIEIIFKLTMWINIRI